ncbi:MAG TPA: hypothetical protein VGN64_06190 [Dyadobacter sp.]|jgi:hypothetical protein|nr:hypothetical protein [Dyadobacter sp.]
MFEFYFQSGEFVGDVGGFSWWKDFVVPFSAAAVPVGIFLWQQAYERLKEKNRRLAVDQDNIIYLRLLITGAMNYISAIVEKLGKVEEDKDSFGFKSNPYSPSSSNDLVRIIQTLDQDKYFHSYVSIFPEKHSDIQSIFSEFDIADQLRMQIEGSADRYYSDLEFTCPAIEDRYLIIKNNIRSIKARHQAPKEIITAFEDMTPLEAFKISDMLNEENASLFQEVATDCEMWMNEGRNAFNEIHRISGLAGGDLRKVIDFKVKFISDSKDSLEKLIAVSDRLNVLNTNILSYVPKDYEGGINIFDALGIRYFQRRRKKPEGPVTTSNGA